MAEPITLEYGRPPRRRWGRRVGIAVLTILLIGVAVYYRAPIKAYAIEQHAAWRFRQTFDGAAEDLFDGSDFWAPGDRSVNADEVLSRLHNATTSLAKAYRGTKPNTVLFARKGVTAGHEWIAFACMNSTGLEVYTFDRTQRAVLGYDRLLETRQFFGIGSYKQGSLNISVGEVRRSGDVVVTLLTVNGGENVIEWSIAAAPSVARRSNVMYTSELILCVATPRTGWVTGDDWWPDVGDVTRLEGGPPPVELPAIKGVAGISFVPDGRIAFVAPGALGLIDVQTRKFEQRPIWDIKTGSDLVTAFSPDGKTCYVGAFEWSFVVPTLGGEPTWHSYNIGRPRPQFVNDTTLLIQDNTQLRRANCATGEVVDEPQPVKHLRNYAQQGDVVAYSSYSSAHTGVTVRQGDQTIKIVDDPDEMSLSPDGRWLALRNSRGIIVFDTRTGVAVLEHDADVDMHSGHSRVEWSRDGSMGAIAGNKFVYVWSLKPPGWMARMPHGRKWPRFAVALSEDGQRLAVSSGASESIGYWPDIRATTQPTR